MHLVPERTVARGPSRLSRGVRRRRCERKNAVNGRPVAERSPSVPGTFNQIARSLNPYRAVWVFFTERDGGKCQVHFFDDRRIVEGFAGSHYRSIDHERSGIPGRGQSVRVSLTGLDDEPIEIAIELADKPLHRIGAGLTNQSGHAADTLFLLFHRDRNAVAKSNEVQIGGSDYSFRAEDDPEGKYRFQASYSAGIQIGIIP